jgi:hypothetical protein
MDKVLIVICDAMGAPENCIMRAGVDREDEHILGSQVDIIISHTYLWAFVPQMFVLLIATILSGYLPQLINEIPN